MEENLFGPSGAGKTTLLNILGGMDTLTTGRVMLDGREISALSKKELTEYRRHDVGFVFQFYNLIGNLTALENVELANQICKNPLDADEILKEQISDALNSYDIKQAQELMERWEAAAKRARLMALYNMEHALRVPSVQSLVTSSVLPSSRPRATGLPAIATPASLPSSSTPTPNFHETGGRSPPWRGRSPSAPRRWRRS